MLRIFTRSGAIFLIGISASLFISGCGSSSAEPQSIASSAQVNNFVEMRKYFDEAGGDWSKLSPENQAAYNKLAGDATKGQSIWKSMGSGGGANAAGPR